MAWTLLSIIYSNPAYLTYTPEHSPTQLLLLPGYQGYTHTHTMFCPAGPEGADTVSREGEKVRMQTKGTYKRTRPMEHSDFMGVMKG